MGLRGLLRCSSDAVRALRSRAPEKGSNALVTGYISFGAESFQRSGCSSIVRDGCLQYARYVSSAYLRSGSSNSTVTKLSPSFSAAALSTLSSPRATWFPSCVRSILEPRFRGDGLLVQQPTSPSMQQKRGVSKLKKYKMKAYSSYKERFKLMADGTYKRWRSGTRHNAHSKTAKQRRQLRRPSTAPVALAKVMKKLNFMG